MNHHLLSLLRLHCIRALCVTLFASATLTGCLLPEDEEKTPAPSFAAIQVLHLNSKQASVEVLFDNTPILIVSPDSQIGAVEIPVVSGTFAFRNLGAVDPYFETEILELNRDQVYSFVLQREDEQDRVLDLTSPPPMAEMGRHWLRFVNLSDLDEGNVFYDRTRLISLPLESNPSEFLSVEAQSGSEMAISDGEGVPISFLDDVSLIGGGASIFIIANERGDSGNIKLYNLPLMIDYVGFSSNLMDYENAD